MGNAGQEVWGWADSFSARVHRLDRIRRLTAEIASIGRSCGDCGKWMKSRQCPREANVNGQSRGPSSEALICGQFLESGWATGRRVTLQRELEAESAPQPDQGHGAVEDRR